MSVNCNVSIQSFTSGSVRYLIHRISEDRKRGLTVLASFSIALYSYVCKLLVLLTL